MLTKERCCDSLALKQTVNKALAEPAKNDIFPSFQSLSSSLAVFESSLITMMEKTVSVGKFCMPYKHSVVLKFFLNPYLFSNIFAHFW